MPERKELTNRVVALYRERFGRGPTVARCHVHETFALVILGEVSTIAEKALIAQHEGAHVIRGRVLLGAGMEHELRKAVEETTGRTVRSVMGDYDPDEDLAALVFVFDKLLEEANGVERLTPTPT